MTTRKKRNDRAIYRSAKTGRVVTKRYAKAHPSTTQLEHRPAPRRTSRTSSRRGR